MSGYGYYPRDPYAAERVYPGTGFLPPPRSQPTPQQLIYPQAEQVYRACNQPPAPPAAPAPQPSTREVKVIYYVPGDPNFLPPAPPAPAPVAALPAAPRPSYVEMPASGSSNQFREGDTYRVVAIQENSYKAQQPYRYPGGYFQHAPGPPQRGGPVGYPTVYYQ